MSVGGVCDWAVTVAAMPQVIADRFQPRQIIRMTLTGMIAGFVLKAMIGVELCGVLCLCGVLHVCVVVFCVAYVAYVVFCVSV